MMSRNSTTTSCGLGFYRIRCGRQRGENENNSSVVTHLHSPHCANRCYLPARDDWNRAALFSKASERFARCRKRAANRLGLAGPEVRIAPLFLAAAICRRLCNRSVRREQQGPDKRGSEKINP